MKEEKTCPDCGEGHPLHEIDDGIFGCDNCKQTFDTNKEAPPSQHTPGKFGRDEWGNPIIPEPIL